jgi:hypothetical protein
MEEDSLEINSNNVKIYRSGLKVEILERRDGILKGFLN